MTTPIFKSGANSTMTSVTIDGTTGAGYLSMQNQSVIPATPASGSVRVYADSSSNYSWISSAGIVATLNNAGMTTSRTFALPDVSGEFVCKDGTVPTTGYGLKYNGTAWTPAPTYCWTIKDVKTVGTNGGSITSGAWTARDLNTLAGSVDTSVTIASNQITFTAGTYLIRGSVPGYCINLHRARLYNVTTSAEISLGTSSSSASSSNVTSTSLIEEQVTFASTTVVSVQQICTSTRASDGLGIATGISGENEIYTSLSIIKLY